MRMTGQQKWAAACGVQMFIIGVFGMPHRSFAQITPGPTVAAAMPASAASAREPEPLSDANAVRLTVGRSTLVDIGQPISRVSLTKADVADALVTSPNQLLVHGKVPGATCAQEACGVPKTPMMNIWTPHAAAHFCCPVIRIVLLLRHDFLRALVAADDFDRRGRRGRWGGCRLLLARGWS